MKVEPPSRRPLTGVIFGDRSAARSALAAVAEGKRWISAVFGELGSKIGEKCKCHELVNTPPIRGVFVNSASVRIGVVFPLGLPPTPSIVLNDNGYPPGRRSMPRSTLMDSGAGEPQSLELASIVGESRPANSHRGQRPCGRTEGRIHDSS